MKIYFRCLFGDVWANEEESASLAKQLCAFILKLSALDIYEEIHVAHVTTDLFQQIQILLR